MMLADHLAALTFTPTAPVATPEALCEHCGGMGWYRQGLDDLIPCGCTTEKRQKRTFEEMYLRSGMTSFRGRTFSVITTIGKKTVGSPDLAIAKAQAWCKTPTGFFILRGQTGQGKTSVAMGIANDFLDRGEHVLFVDVPTLLRRLRATFAGNTDLDFSGEIERLCAIHLLVLDEFAMEPDEKRWIIDVFYQVTNTRLENHLPTVFTTNQTMKDFEPRIRSRLLDAGHQVVEIRDIDRRISR